MLGSIFVGCAGFCRVFVNGVHVSGATMLGHQSDFERTVLYDSFDVGAVLRAGDNVVGVEVSVTGLGSRSRVGLRVTG